MWSKIDILKLTQSLLPTALRLPRLLAFLRSMVQPMTQIHAEFDAFSFSVRRKVGNATLSIIMLEKLLNDEFLYYDNEVYVTDYYEPRVLPAATHVPVDVYKAAIGTPLEIFPASVAIMGVDYVVNIPAEIDSTSNREIISSIIEYYRMPGKTYSIHSYE